MWQKVSGAQDMRRRVRTALDRCEPLNWLILGGVLLIATIVIGTAIAVSNFRQRALSNSQRELENTVLLLTRHFDRELSDFEAVQNDVVRRMEAARVATPDAFRQQWSSEQFHTDLEAVAAGHRDESGIHVFDADGELINASQDWPVHPLRIADRGYFQELAADKHSPSVVLTPLRSRFTGKWTTVISSKVTGPDGQFLGVVTRGITSATFERFFESLELGRDSTIAVVDRDGTLLARFPHVEEMMGRNLRSGPGDHLLSKVDHGSTRLTSPIDGQDRLASARALSKFPLSFIATRTVTAALADWRAQTQLLSIAAGLAALVLASTLLLIVRMLSRQHHDSERRLALEKERLDTAVNNMTQGLLLYDADARIVLCNQRYLEMYNLPADKVKPGCHFRELIAFRKQTGSFAGDVDAFCSTVLRNVAEKRATQSILETTDGRSMLIVNKPLSNGGWVTTQEDITERRRAEKQIAHMAHYDALTDLPNRALFRQRLEGEIGKVNRGEQLAVLYIDIDEFKSVNDSLGHPVGDELLKSVAGRLRACVRETDIVARLGGDEFAIIQTGISQPCDVIDLVSRVYRSIREPIECLGHQVTTDASIGIALAPQDGRDLDQLLKNADLAMYGAKAEGRRTYRFFEPEMDARVKARHTLELDLRQAIADGAFELNYQPVVGLRSNKVVGCEALLRWNHPVRGRVSPSEFIPVAEDTGLICQIGDWVLAQACAEAANWPPDIRVAVNVSPVQFRSHAFELKVAKVLAATGLPAARLELEITEAVLIRDDEAALATLQQLSALGVRIALDDFGTGYSSLSYLQRFPFDKIKIDRCFIDGIAESEGSAAIVQAVISIARARNMMTTAEGVETEQQREILRTLGCTEMQGFLFSQAQPAAEISKLLSRSQDIAAA